MAFLITESRTAASTDVATSTSVSVAGEGRAPAPREIAPHRRGECLNRLLATTREQQRVGARIASEREGVRVRLRTRADHDEGPCVGPRQQARGAC